MRVAVTTVRLNRPSHLLCEDLTQCWLGKTRSSLVKATPLGVMSVSDNICPCAESERLLRLVRRKVMLHTFTVGFRKFIRVVFYFSWICPV